MALNDRITLRTLVDEVIPQLATSEKLMHNTLRSVLAVTRDPAQRARREQQQQALDLELFRIRLNFDNLLRRHADDVAALVRTGDCGPLLQLDPGEAEAVRSARRLYEKVKSL